ncbi:MULTISPECIES: oligosaccharide repeat unit polymerase [unclassified Providencia]|uniref:oligosaccharide repeat unit polymerase n=1 Tax=unclassified Providencia TaxID=2633465 RepID=UPI00234A4E21|nr:MULTISPECIES: oligosaccharide repeat unit polymerase [unclassified Providencia]
MKIEEFLILLITIFISFIIFFRIKKINIASSECIFLLFFFFYCTLGSLILLLGLDKKRLNGIAVNDEYLLDIWIYCSISIIIIMSITSIFKRNLNEFPPPAINYNNTPSLTLVFFITIIISMVSIIYIVSTNSPMYLLFKSGNVVDAFYARQTENNDSGFFKEQHIKFLTNEIGFFWTVFLYCNVIFKKRFKLLFLVSFLVLSMTLASNLSKGGVIFLISSLGIIYLYKNNKRLTFSWLLLGSMFIISIASLVQYYLLPNEGGFDFFTISGAVLSRITTGQLAPSYYVLDFIHNSDYLYGTSLPNPKSILPFTYFDLETKTWELMNTYRSALGLTYKNPTVFWADGYANFGFLGVILYSIIIGFIFVIIDTYFFRKKELELSDLALLIYLSFHYARLSGKSLGPFLWDLNLIFVLLFYITLKKLTSNERYL